MAHYRKGEEVEGIALVRAPKTPTETFIHLVYKSSRPIPGNQFFSVPEATPIYELL